MLISEDDLNDTIVPRLMAAGADLSRVYFAKQTLIVGENGKRATRRIALDSDLSAVRRILAERTEIKLIVIDPLGSYPLSSKKIQKKTSDLFLQRLRNLLSKLKSLLFR